MTFCLDQGLVGLHPDAFQRLQLPESWFGSTSVGEVAEEEEHGDPKSSGPRGEADTKGPPPLASVEDAVSPEEDALLMQPASQPEDLVAGSHSPRSETGMVLGEMAELCLTSPSQPGHEEDETQL